MSLLSKDWQLILCPFSVQSLSRVWLFVIPLTAARQASLSITNSWSLLKLMSIVSVMPFNHLILCHPLLLPPTIFPRVFSNESVLCIRWPKYILPCLHPYGRKGERTKEPLYEGERGKWKCWLKTQYSKNKDNDICPITSWQIDEKTMKQWQTLFSWAPKSLQMVSAVMKLKEACSLEEKLWPT